MFVAMTTQWRIAEGGVLVGMDYSAIMPVLRLSKVPRSEWPTVFEDLRTMERAALDARARRGK